VRRHVPNLLTAGRFFLAIGFFIVLAFYHAEAEPAWPVIDVALAIFLVAVATDVVDGYLARRMGHQTAFGRIADPFVDKIIICGAMVYFIGGEFIRRDGVNLTGWQTWMVVVILAREFLVSAVRGYSESRGMKFPAIPAGKIKMFVQSFTICAVLFQLANVPDPAWAVYAKLILVWLAVLVTVFSALWYVGKIRRLLRSDE